MACQTKEKGGSVVENLMKRNRSLLVKWLWRFQEEKESLRQTGASHKWLELQYCDPGLKPKSIESYIATN